MNVWRAFYPITQNHKLLIKVLKETSQLSQVLISHFSLLFSCSLLVLFSYFIYFSLKLHSPSPILLLPPSPLHTAPAWSSCFGLWRHITRRAEPYDSWGFKHLRAWPIRGGVFTGGKRDQKREGTEGLHQNNFLDKEIT